MNQDIREILLDEGTIHEKVRDIGCQISRDYEGTVPVLVCVLKGAFVFLSDLMRSVTIPAEIDFLSISSYGDSMTSSGVVQFRMDLDTDIAGRDVLIVEDIADSGLSLSFLLEHLRGHKPRSLKTCVLLDKPEAHKMDLQLDYTGFSIGNEFVVGYGLDFAGKYRNLPFIGVLKEEIYRDES